MKHLFTLFAIVASTVLYGATGWFSDYVLINPNGVGTGYYWIGNDPSYGTQLNGNAFGTVNTLVITGADMKYWSDTKDRTGGAFYYKIMSADGSTQIIAPTEIVWVQSYLTGNDYQGLKTVTINLLAGLSPATTYQLHVWAKHWGSDQVDNWLSNGGSNYVATFTTSSSYYFTGVGAWSSAVNWTFGVPTTTSSAVIDGSATIGSDIVVENLTINAAKSLTINSGNSLTVTGTLTNSAGASGLVIESGGSLKQGSAGVSATVKRSIEAWGGAAVGWHLLSSPVTDQPFQPGFVSDPPSVNEDFYLWKESTNEWINSKVGASAPYTFNSVDFGNNFAVGQGYLVAYSATSPKEFTGTLTTGDVAGIQLSYTTSSGRKGWNLLGNPYTCGLKWNAATWAPTNTHIEGVAKIVNSTTGAYVDISADGTIPAMNGFFVRTDAATTLTIPASERIIGGTWYKQSSSSEPFVLTVVDIEGGTAQETKIVVNEEATPGYDRLYDGSFAAFYAPKFYSIAGDNKLSTNSMPEYALSNEVLLGFEKNTGTSYRIEATGVEALNAIPYLIDLKTGFTQNLSENPVYNFVSVDGDSPSRFKLTFSGVGLDSPVTTDPQTIFTYGNQLFIQNPGTALVEIYTFAGQLVARQNVNESGLWSQPLHLSAGQYVVRVVNGSFAKTAKVVLF